MPEFHPPQIPDPEQRWQVECIERMRRREIKYGALFVALFGVAIISCVAAALRTTDDFALAMIVLCLTCNMWRVVYQVRDTRNHLRRFAEMLLDFKRFKNAHPERMKEPDTAPTEATKGDARG